MLAQKNKVGMLFGGFIALALAGFTTWRTIDLLTQVLPASQQLAAIFGVAAFDGGLLAWTFLFLKAKGTDQHTIAGWLAGIDFVAVGVATVLDLVLAGVNKGVIASNPNLYVGAIIVVAVVVMINVGGGLLYAMNDPKAKQEMRDQRAHDKINDLAEQQIEQHAEMYAPQFAQVKVDAWLARARMVHGLPQLQQFTSTQPQLPSGPVVDATALPQTGSLPAVQQPQKNGLIGAIKQAIVGGNQQPVCAAHGTPAVGQYLGIWHCQSCMETIMESLKKPQTNVQPEAITGQWHVPPTTSPLAAAPSNNQNQSQNGANSSNGHNK